MLQTKISLNFCAIINAYIIIDNKTADFDIYSCLIHATLFTRSYIVYLSLTGDTRFYWL